jgi:hypothetical protein
MASLGALDLDAPAPSLLPRPRPTSAPLILYSQLRPRCNLGEVSHSTDPPTILPPAGQRENVILHLYFYLRPLERSRIAYTIVGE